MMNPVLRCAIHKGSHIGIIAVCEYAHPETLQERWKEIGRPKDTVLAGPCVLRMTVESVDKDNAIYSTMLAPTAFGKEDPGRRPMLGDLLDLGRLLWRAVDFGQPDVSNLATRTGHDGLNHPKTGYGHRQTVRGTFPGCAHGQNQLLIEVSIGVVMTAETRRDVKEVRLRVPERQRGASV